MWKWKLNGNEVVVAVYAEHCTMAGKRCWDEDMIERESDDIVVYGGTPAELAATADALAGEQAGAGAGHDIYLSRVIRVLREAAGLEAERKEG